MSRIGSILNEELAHQRNGSSFAFVPLRHSQPQVELWPIRSQQPPMRPKEPPNPLSTIFRLHRIFIFSFSFLQGLQSSLLRPSWQNTHPAVQSGASNVLLRNFSKIIPFHRILQRHVHTQQHSKEDPLHDVYPAPDRLEPIDTQMRMWMSCTSCSIRTDSTQSTPQRSTTRSVRICSPKTTTSPLCPAPTPRIPLPTQVQFLFISEVCRHHQRHQHRQQYILRWLLHLQQGDDTQ